MVDSKSRPAAATAEPSQSTTAHHQYNSAADLSATPISIPKNSREDLRISIDEFKGRRLLNFRVWYQPDGGGEMRPGRDGVAISVDRLDEVIAALVSLASDNGGAT